MAPQFVADGAVKAPCCETARDRRRDEISHLHPRSIMHARIQHRCHDHTKKVTMGGHATFLDFEDVKRVGEILVGLVEQHVSRAPAKNHTEHVVEEYAVKVTADPVFGHGVRLACMQSVEPQKRDKHYQIHQAVSAGGE